jgi:hypothetical protein
MGIAAILRQWRLRQTDLSNDEVRVTNDELKVMTVFENN